MSQSIDSQIVEGLLSHNGWQPNVTVLALANSTLALTVASTVQHVFTGAVAGQILRLPDATTLGNGHRFDIYNEGTTTLSLQNSTGASLTYGLAKSYVKCVLQSNSTAAGIWLFSSVITGQTSGVINYKVTSTASFAPGTADVVVTGMSVTPVAGTYAIWYHASCKITGNNTILTTSIFNGATQVTDSVRTIGSSVSTFNTNHATQSTVQFNGTNTCEIHVSRTGNALTVTGRSLILIRLGD